VGFALETSQSSSMNHETTISGDRRSRSLTRVVVPLVALLLVLVASASLFVVQSWSVIPFPYPVDYGEGPLLDQSVRLAHGRGIYPAKLTAPPYAVANYPPLYPLLQAPWVRWFGPAFWYGRLLSWLSMVASAFLVAGILRVLTRQWLPSVVGGLTLLAVPYVAYWGALYRIDALALALSLAALYSIVRWPGRATALVAAAVLLTAAIYTRQSYALAAPLAAWSWLVTRPAGPRKAWALAALVSGLSAGTLLALQLATDGGFLFHTVTANLNEFRIERLLRYAGELGRLLPGLLLCGIVYVGIGRRGNRSTWWLVVPYLGGAALAGLTIGKNGSNVNYLLELSVALSLAAGALLAELASRPALRAVAALVLLVQASLLLGGTRYQQHVRWKLDQRAELERLMQIVHRAEGTVLADEALGLLPLDGRAVHAQPFELTQLARHGDWDPTPFLDELERREFSAVLIYRVPWSPIHRTRWTPEMLERLERGYEVRGAVGHTVIYRPKPF
jgi:hypothetical protein